MLLTKTLKFYEGYKTEADHEQKSNINIAQ